MNANAEKGTELHDGFESGRLALRHQVHGKWFGWGSPIGLGSFPGVDRLIPGTAALRTADWIKNRLPRLSIPRTRVLRPLILSLITAVNSRRTPLRHSPPVRPTRRRPP